MNVKELIKPPRLKRTDTICIWSPSYPGAARYPRRLSRGIKALEDLGFRVKLAPLCRSDIGYVSAHPKDLAEELHNLSLDESIRCVISSLGGNLSARLLPYLDFDLIRQHPKIYIGYSDFTSIILALYVRSNLVTFHGPAVLPEIAEPDGPYEYTLNCMLQVLMSPEPPGKLNPPEIWTDEYQAWDQDDTRARVPRGQARWLPLREGAAEGILIGGCIPTVDLLFGTPYFPDLEGALLFLEQEEPSQDEFCAYLNAFQSRGMLTNLKGIIFGRLSRPNMKLAPDIGFQEVALACLTNLKIPVAWDVDLGHTEPKITLPIGIKAKLSIRKSEASLSLLEGAVS